MLLPVVGQQNSAFRFPGSQVPGRQNPGRPRILLHLHSHLSLPAHQDKGFSQAGCNFCLAEGSVQKPSDIICRLIPVQIAVKCLLSRLFFRLEYQPALHEQRPDSGPGDFAAVRGIAHENPLQRFI